MIAKYQKEITDITDLPDGVVTECNDDSEQQKGHGCKLLLVDDEPEILEEMSDFLEREGYACVTAGDAREAIDAIKKDTNINIIITDIRMPGMSGLDLIRHLRHAMPPDHLLEIIVLTGHAGRNEAIEALQAGARDFLIKPVSLKQLLISTKRAIETVRWRKMEKNHKDSLKGALEKERNLNQMQRDFISMVSHEFRTPLAVIDGTAQRIIRQKNPMTAEILSERVSTIRTTIKKMTALIDETLCITRHEEGMLNISIQPCDLNYILQDICDKQLQINENRNVMLNTETIPDIVHADPNHLDHIFTNLISNAIKYSKQSQPVEVRAWADHEGVYVSVLDRGIGIPGNEIPFVFNRFYRASTSAGINGTGIGLYLVKILTEMHGGCVEINSTVGEGSTFIVHLPNNLNNKPINHIRIQK